MKLSLAPIQGMTIHPYRNAFNGLFSGIDHFYSPFITTTDYSKESTSRFKDVLPTHNQNISLTPQLLSNNGVDFRHYASKLFDMDYKEINWNIGCPYPMVTKKKKGSGLMPHPDLIKTFLEEVCSDDNYALTIKMRLGLTTVEEGLSVLEVLNNYPIKEVIIHSRIGSQKYEGTVDLEGFDSLLKASKHPVAYNGDIFTVEDYNKISNKFPSITHFMLGRGALRDPFLPGMIKGRSFTSAEKLYKIKALHDAMYNYYSTILSGDKHLIDRMKEFWTYNITYIDHPDLSIKQLKKCLNKSDYLRIVDNMFKHFSNH